MKVIMKMIHLLWTTSILSGAAALLSGDDCLNLTEDQADQCDNLCANQVCIRKRYEESESKCYGQFIKSLPEEEIDEMLKQPADQPLVLRKYMSTIEYHPENIENSQENMDYLTNAGEEDYKNIIKIIFPLRDYEAENQCGPELDYKPIWKIRSEKHSYSTCQSIVHEDCIQFRQNKLNALKNFRSALKELEEGNKVYALGRIPIYTYDPEPSTPHAFQSMINDHLARTLAKEIKRRNAKNEVLEEKISRVETDCKRTKEQIENEIENIEENITEINNQLENKMNIPDQTEGGEEDHRDDEDYTNGSGIVQPYQPPSYQPQTHQHRSKGEKGEPGQCEAIQCKGTKGQRGERGYTGMDGLQGLQGLQGIQGPQGVQGPPGPQGAEGRPGLPGLPGHNKNPTIGPITIDNQGQGKELVEVSTTPGTMTKQGWLERFRGENPTNASRLLDPALLNAAAEHLNTEKGKVKAVAAVMQMMMRKETNRLEKKFHRIANEGLNATRKEYGKVVNEELNRHPLFNNRKRYEKNINMTRDEFTEFLEELSYDPEGRVSLTGLVTAIVTCIGLIITSLSSCVARRKMEYQMQKMAEKQASRRNNIRQLNERSRMLIDELESDVLEPSAPTKQIMNINSKPASPSYKRISNAKARSQDKTVKYCGNSE